MFLTKSIFPHHKAKKRRFFARFYREMLQKYQDKKTRASARARVIDARDRRPRRREKGYSGGAAPGQFSGFPRLGAVFPPMGESPPLAAAKSIFCETRKLARQRLRRERGATPAAQAACARPWRGPRTAPACGPEPAAAVAAPRYGSEPEGKRRNQPRSHRGFITVGLPVKATQKFFPVKSISGKNFRGPDLDRRRRLVRRDNQAVIGDHRPQKGPQRSWDRSRARAIPQRRGVNILDVIAGLIYFGIACYIGQKVLKSIEKEIDRHNHSND